MKTTPCPWEFIDIKAAADETMRRLREEKAAEDEKVRQQEEKQRIRAAGNAVFARLMDSGEEGKAICEQWNSFTSTHNTQKDRERFVADSRFMELYRAAMDSSTLPSKRKTIRVFFEYLESQYGRTLKPIEYVDEDRYIVLREETP